MPDDILDAAQKNSLPPEPDPVAIPRDAAALVERLLETNNPAPVTPTSPSHPIGKPKSRIKGGILAVLALLLIALPVGVYFISQQYTSIADIRNQATGPYCFLAGTQIQTPNGNRSIETLASGDPVYAFDAASGTIRVERVQSRIENTSDHYYLLSLSDGTTLQVTGRHPMYRGASYVSPHPDEATGEPQYPGFEAVSRLTVGDTLYKESELTRLIPVSVVSLEKIQGSVPVYNLSVTGTSTYFAETIAVHNKNPADTACEEGGLKCANGYRCNSDTHTCKGNTNTTTCGRNTDMRAPVCCTELCSPSNLVCEGSNRLECNIGGIHCTIDADGCTEGVPDDNAGGTGGSTAFNALTENTPIPTATSAVLPNTPVCLNIKIYKNGVQVTPSSLLPGDEAVLAVAGSMSPTQARFRINGGAWTETANKNGSNEFTLDYTIPEGITDFVIEGEVFTDGAWR